MGFRHLSLRGALVEITGRLGAPAAKQPTEGPPGPPSRAVAERTVSAAPVVLVGLAIVPANAEPRLAWLSPLRHVRQPRLGICHQAGQAGRSPSLPRPETLAGCARDRRGASGK
jgi:hypothetical protein